MTTRLSENPEIPDNTGKLLTVMGENPAGKRLFQQHLYEQKLLPPNGVKMHRHTTQPTATIPLHNHHFSEIIYCKQAEGVKYLIGTRRYTLQQGDILMIPAGTAHCPLFMEDIHKPFIRDELWLSHDTIMSFGRRMSDNYLADRKNAYFLRTTGTKWSHIEQLFEKGIQESESQNYRWENYVFGIATLLFVEIWRAMLDEDTPHLEAENEDLFDRILLFVEQNLSRKITLEDTARIFFVSKSTINRVFQKRMGTSFYKHVTQRRLITAKEQLLSGTPLERIGRQVGFSDYPTFYRAFKGEYGVSPKQFILHSQSTALSQERTD